MDLIGLFMFSLLLATLFIAFWLGLREGLKMWRENNAQNRRDKMSVAYSQVRTADNSHTELIQSFIESEGSSEYKILDFWGNYSTKLMLEELEENHKQYKITSSVCSTDIVNNKVVPTSCSTIIKLDNGIFLKLITWKTGAKDSEGLDVYEVPSHTTVEELTENGLIEYTQQIMMVFPAQYTIESDAIKDIIYTIQDSKLTRINRSNKERTSLMSRLSWNSVAGMYLEDYSKKVQVATDTYLDLAYNKAKVSFNGQEVSIAMSKMVKVMLNCIGHQENICIFGSPGTGKTRLKDQLELMLDKDDFDVIELTTEILEDLQGVVGQAEFRSALSRRDTNKKTVLFIDEAERLLLSDDGIHTKNSGFLLQLLDGSIQEALNCCTVLVFNAPPSKLNSALFRKGRIGLQVELQPIKEEQARQLVRYIRNISPDKTFDIKEFENLVENYNYLTGSTTPYASAGETTLADVWSCFVPYDKRALIMNMIREEAGEIIPSRPDNETPTSESLIVDEKVRAIQEKYLKEGAPSIPPAANTRNRDRRRRRKRT